MTKIRSVTITPMPGSLLDPMPKVIAEFNDGTIKELFSFYPDEIQFQPSEFVGLTEAQARHLKFVKDKAYLTN